MAIGVRWGSATDAGRVRELNEDSLLAAPPLFAVADGVGGHAAGEVASGIAVQGLGRFAGSRAVEASSVIAAVRSVNGEIRSQAGTTPSTTGEPSRNMGSTVVGLALSWYENTDTVLVFNVGDSRAFRLTGRRLAQISQDHSLVDELLRAGHITAEEAVVHPHRSVITRALGAQDDVDVDSWHVEALVGDRYLLCSDGLTNEVGFVDIERVLLEVADLDEAARELIDLALEHGGRDNVTAVVVEVTDVEPFAVAGEVLHTAATPTSSRGVGSDSATLPLPEAELPDAPGSRAVPATSGPATDATSTATPIRSSAWASPPQPTSRAAQDDRPTNPAMSAQELADQGLALPPAAAAPRPLGRRPRV